MKISAEMHGYGNCILRIESGEWIDAEDCLEDLRKAIDAFGNASILWHDTRFMLEKRRAGE